MAESPPDPVDPPTSAELQRVREHECAVEGHTYDVITVVGSSDPHTIVCSNCGQSWSIADHLPEMYECIIGEGEDRRVYVCPTHGLLDVDSLTIHHDCCHCGQRALRFEVAHDQRLPPGQN